MTGNSQSAREIAEDRYYSALDHYAEGRVAQAIAEYEASLAADPIAVALRITEIDPDDVLAHTSLSILYQRKGMVPEAEAEAAKARVLGWKQQLKQGKK